MNNTLGRTEEERLDGTADWDDAVAYAFEVKAPDSSRFEQRVEFEDPRHTYRDDYEFRNIRPLVVKENE